MSIHVPLMIGTGMSHKLGIPTSKDNPSSFVQAGGIGNKLSALVG